ncbi:MAG: hypothetical protein PWP23_2562 [Candidatus Sumerlaeota bacterium]|nr:hypothetical protein [Candidatus Sumerlaeota bacterium]
MRLAKSYRLSLTALALSGIAASAVLADPMVPYGEAIISRESLARKSALPTHPVISDDLYTIVREIRAQKSVKAQGAFIDKLNATRPKPLAVLKRDDPSKIEVTIHLAYRDPYTIEVLKKSGAEIEIEARHAPLIQAYVPLDVLEQIAALPNVRQITRPNYALATAGRITTQGDQAMATTVVRNYADDAINGVTYDGNAVKIVVASDNLFLDGSSVFGPGPCNNLQLVRDTERPVGIQSELPMGVYDRCPSEPSTEGTSVPPSGFFGGIPISPATHADHVLVAPTDTAEDIEYNFFPEGAAMMEVIHDVAPGADMRYIRGRTDLELIERRNVVSSLGFPVDVMVDNLVFTGAGRYDGSSAVSRSATEFSRTRNVPFFVSAGGVTPQGDSTTVRVERFPLQINGFFNADPRDQRVKIHSWSAGSASNRDEALSIDGVAGEPIEITLVWDDYWDDVEPRATTDFDLFLIPRSTLSLDQAVASSQRLQNGSGVNPVERLVYLPLSDAPLALVMINKNGGQNVRTLFTLAIEQGQVAESKYMTHGVALNNSDALDPVISVGHIDLELGLEDVAFDVMPGIVPGSTPQGEFITWFEGQTYPTVVGYSSVNTYTTNYLVSARNSRQLEDPLPFINSFTGPSAATAHLAGFAAILRHRFPQMPARRVYQLFTDVSGQSDTGEVIAPLARDITTEETLAYANAPRYLRPNPFLIYDNLSKGKVDPYNTAAKNSLSLVEVTDEGGRDSDWIPSTTPSSVAAFDVPEYRVSDLGLEMKATSDFCFGYWESPVLTVQGADDESPRSTLRTDRVYVAEARVGSTGTDPLRVPDFRLRLTTTAGDESSMVVIADVSEGTDNAPTTIGGKVYQVHFRPSNEAVAQQGVRFYFEMLNFTPSDDQDVSLILRDFSIRELPLPEEAP